MVEHVGIDMRFLEAIKPWLESTSALLRPRPAIPPPPAQRGRTEAALLQALQRLRQRQINKRFKTQQLPHKIQYPVGVAAQSMPKPMAPQPQILESVPQVH